MTEYVEIGLLIPEKLPLEIIEFIIVVMMLEVYIGLLIPDTLPLAMVEFIIVETKVVTVAEVDISLKISVTLPLRSCSRS